MELDLSYYTSDEFLDVNALPHGEYTTDTEHLRKPVDETEETWLDFIRVSVMNSDGYIVKTIDLY